MKPPKNSPCKKRSSKECTYWLALVLRSLKGLFLASTWYLGVNSPCTSFGDNVCATNYCELPVHIRKVELQ